MNLYIIRHGETTWNSQNRIQGHSDPELSELGRKQARLLAKRFKNSGIDGIYTSPLRRAADTAELIAKSLKVKVKTEAGLKEVMLGEWEGKTTDEVDLLYSNSYQKWLRDGPTKVKIPRAEGISAFRGRVEKVLGKIIRQNRDKNILVVTHGGVIAAFLAHLLDADFDKLILTLHIPNTCVTLVSSLGQRHCLIHIADTMHLRGTNGPTG